MKEIREKVWFIGGAKKGRFPYSHSLYLEDPGGLLIDAGAGPVLQELSGKTEQVVLSHYHRDHVSYNSYFTGAAFSVHREDAPGIETFEGFSRLSGLDQLNLENFWEQDGQIKFLATKADRYLSEGDYLDFAGLKVKVLHLPGHTPGHCGFLVEKYNLLFASDIDLTRFGPWYGNPSSNIEQFRRSIRRVRELKPALLVTGHVYPVAKNIDQKLSAYEAEIDRRDEEIVSVLKEGPHSLEQLAQMNIIYPRHYNQEILLFFEKNMLQKHLESLVKRRMASKTEEGLFEAL